MLLTESINVKALTPAQKQELCGEIRDLLISVVSKNGGHLSSNLGTVELIVAMHSVFETPRDKFVFDVGHQAYTHKLLTGRFPRFERLRQANGISGFPRPSESEHDAFIAGHAGISVSAGLGIAAAMKLKGEEGSVIVVAGDGSFTSGEIFEGLNNAGKTAGNFIVILNDNEMCISKSSGAVAAYLSQMRSTKGYNETKKRIKKLIGKTASNAVREAKRVVKHVIIPDNLFENLGLKYLGPVDGHNLQELTGVLELAGTIDAPCLVHVKTKKGKGYHPAENNAGHYHGLDRKNASSPGNPTRPDTYADVFGKEIARLAAHDERICLITAAMKYATGCNYFAKAFPGRFFDTGIAESHAMTFAAGLAAGGRLPVFAVYSTFLQRCFDQLIHDAAIEKLRMVLAVDRAGLIGEDGPTHQGTFDVGMLSMVPGTTVYSPLSVHELRLCLHKALYGDTGISAVRYPRGTAMTAGQALSDTDYADYTFHKSDTDTGKLVVTYGRISRTAMRLVKHGADVLRLVKIHPIPEEAHELISGYNDVIFFEEGSVRGGVAEGLAARHRMRIRGVEGFAGVADLEAQLKACGLDFAGMKEFAAL